jgi:PAS domain S-box-containing protein
VTFSCDSQGAINKFKTGASPTGGATVGTGQRINAESLTDAAAPSAGHLAGSGAPHFSSLQRAPMTQPDNSTDGIAARYLRMAPASLLIFILVWLASELGAGLSQPVLFGLYGVAAASCAIFLMLIGRASFHQHWHALILTLTAVLFASSAAIATITSQCEPLFILVIAAVIGCAALMPWSVRWQGALSVLGIMALAAQWYFHSTFGVAVVYRWAGLALIIALAHFTTLIRTRKRFEASERMRSLREQHDLLLVEIERRREQDAARERAQRQLAQSAQTELLAAREELSCQIAALRESQRQLRAEIAERELAQKKVQESEATLRKIFDTTLVAIAIVRKEGGRFVGANREFLRLFGYSWEEIQGRPFQQVTGWVDRDQLLAFSRALAEAGAVAETEADVHAKGGRVIPLQISAAAVELNGEPCIITMSRDITRRRLAERDMIHARETALAASQAKSDFLSSMSHEIRTPMNAILGMADLLSETPLSDEQRRYLETMRTNGASLLDLINRILDLARIESGQLTLEHAAFRLDDLIEEVLDTLRPHAREKRLELAGHIMEGAPLDLFGDPLRLRQILINLLANAIKFTDRGAVTLTVCCDISASGRLAAPSSSAQTPTVKLRFIVADTGIGIAREKLAAIFSSFTQADSSVARIYGGSGLGLAIVKRLVELMDGEIVADSSTGHGSTFTFTATFATATGVSPRTVENGPALAGPILPQPLRILLAEDSSDNRLLIQAYLKNTPYQLGFAEDGEAAIELFKSNCYDLVLMDIQMPVVDGLTAVRTIRAWERANGHEPVPIIALTASALDESVRRCMNAGCTAHIAKPVRKATLLTAIASALQRDYHAPAAAALRKEGG